MRLAFGSVTSTPADGSTTTKTVLALRTSAGRIVFFLSLAAARAQQRTIAVTARTLGEGIRAPTLYAPSVHLAACRAGKLAENPVFEALRVTSLRRLIANVKFYARRGLLCRAWHILTKSNRLFRVETRRPIPKRCQPPGEDARLNSLSIQRAGRLPIS